MVLDALSVLCAQLTRDLFAIAKFLFYSHSIATMALSCIISKIKRQICGKSRFQANVTTVRYVPHYVVAIPSVRCRLFVTFVTSQPTYKV